MDRSYPQVRHRAIHSRDSASIEAAVLSGTILRIRSRNAMPRGC